MTKIKETSTNFENKKALADECSEVHAANIIGGQWSLVICSWLLQGKDAFWRIEEIYSEYNGTHAGVAVAKVGRGQDHNPENICRSSSQSGI